MRLHWTAPRTSPRLYTSPVEIETEGGITGSCGFGGPAHTQFPRAGGGKCARVREVLNSGPYPFLAPGVSGHTPRANKRSPGPM